MDIPVRSALSMGGRSIRGTAFAVALILATASGHAEQKSAAPDDVTLNVAVKAAFLFNFAKFTDWPAVASAAPFVLCVVGNEAVAGALAETVRGQNIGGHPLDVARPLDGATWRACHLLFVADAEARRSSAGLSAIKAAPVLTISDSKGFAQSGGIIELYVDAGRMRFAINVDAAERSGLHLSSRLLGLANVVRDGR
jgi:hypothetical protein